MTIFQRTSAIFSANLNDLVDRFERPDSMLRQTLREMESLLANTTAAVARSLAAERLLDNACRAQQDQFEKWRHRAEQAVAKQDESLARHAIARQLHHAQSLQSLERELDAAKRSNEHLQRQLTSLRERYAGAQHRAATLAANRAAVDARRQIGESALLSAGSSRLWSRYDEFCRKLELAEAESLALVELELVADYKLESTFAEREMQAAIEQELARLKGAPS